MHNSIYTALYLALLKATELATSTIIYTDSPSAIKNLDNFTKNSHIYTHILNILFKIKKDTKFFWVPGHNNINGNKITDEVAKKTTKKPVTTLWNITTHFNIKHQINLNLHQIWQLEWRLVNKNKLREIKSTTLPWEHDVSFPRRSQIVINRLRIGTLNTSWTLNEQ